MAKKAAAVKQWLGERKRVADLFNVMLFQGEQVVKPTELEPVEGEIHLLIKTDDGKTQEIHRYRDITMRWKGKFDLMILACENQEKIHYAMPVRTMLYDGLSYVQQMKLIWDLRDEEEKTNNDEFLSRFHKDDKIYPVITLVFYFGEKEWDASIDLYGMFEMEEMLRENENLQRYVPNYSINLVDVARLDNLEMFHSDLQVILGLLKCRKDKQKLKEYMKHNNDFFINVDTETGMVISSFMNSDSLMNKLEIQKEGEHVDMCQALEDWAAEEREQGEIEAKKQVARNLIGLLDYETIAEKTELPLEVVKELGIQKGVS